MEVKSKIGLITFLCLSMIVTGCKKNLYKADISSQDLTVNIRRFEKDLFNTDPDSIAERIPGFYELYGEFFDLYNYKIINIGGAGQRTYPEYLKVFLTDYLNNEVYQKTIQRYPDLEDIEEELTLAFRHYHYYFPDKPIPEIITYVSRFNQSIVTAQGIIGIGLDKYLGRDCEYYPQLGLNQYQILNMHPQKIPSDCMIAWALGEYEFNDSPDNLLSNIVYQGQIMFFVKSMLPREADSLIMGFTGDEMNFCRNNEGRMWEYLVENKLLFQTERVTIRKFTGDGPFTKDFTSESPARAAIWLGWRIVEAYARNNQGITLEEVMEEQDYQKVLTLSKYNPH